MTPSSRKIIFVIVLFVVAGLVWNRARSAPRTPKVTYSLFLRQVEAGNVAGAVIAPGAVAAEVIYKTPNGSLMGTVFPSDYRDALATMQTKGVDVEIEEPAHWRSIAFNSLPFLLLLSFWIFLMRRIRSGGSLPF